MAHPVARQQLRILVWVERMIDERDRREEIEAENSSCKGIRRSALACRCCRVPQLPEPLDCCLHENRYGSRRGLLRFSFEK